MSTIYSNATGTPSLSFQNICYCIQGNIRTLLISPLSPSLSLGKYKIWRFPLSETIFLYSQLRLGKFKTGQNCLQVKKNENNGKNNPVYSIKHKFIEIHNYITHSTDPCWTTKQAKVTSIPRTSKSSMQLSVVQFIPQSRYMYLESDHHLTLFTLSGGWARCL